MELIKDIAIPAASALFAAMAVIVAIIALVKSNKAQNKAVLAQNDANSLSKRLLAIEEARETDRIISAHKAIIIPSVEKRETKDYGLYLKNEGEGTASNVRVEVDGSILDKSYKNDGSVVVMKEAPSTIGPSCSYDRMCIFPLWMGMKRKEKIIKVIWDDKSGKDRANEVSF